MMKNLTLQNILIHDTTSTLFLKVLEKLHFVLKQNLMLSM